MSQCTPEQLDKAISNGHIASLYLFDGPEAWLKERVVERLIDRYVTDDSRNFNFDRFDGRSASGHEIVSSIMSFPFVGDRRLVVVKNAEELSAADGRTVGDALSQIPSSSCVIFLYHGKSNLKEDIPARVSEYGVSVTFWTPFANQLPAWIVNQAKQRGKKMSTEAASDLAQFGEDLQSLSNEIDKLVLYVGAKPVIECDDVEHFSVLNDIADTRKLEPFVWRRNLAQTLSQCHLLSEQGVRSEVIIPVFQRVFRTLSLGYYLQQRRLPSSEIYASLRLRGMTQQGNFHAGMKAYSEKEVNESFGKLVKTDEDVKTGLLSSPIALSLMIVDVLAKRRG